MTSRNPCGRGKHDRSDVYPKADRRLYAILARPFFNTPLERRPKERKRTKKKESIRRGSLWHLAQPRKSATLASATIT